MSQSILNGFLIFGIIQVIIFNGLLASKKNRRFSDIIMMAWLSLFVVHCFVILVNLNTLALKNSASLPISLTLLYGPVLFFYFQSISSVKLLQTKVAFLHFIP